VSFSWTASIGSTTPSRRSPAASRLRLPTAPAGVGWSAAWRRWASEDVHVLVKEEPV